MKVKHTIHIPEFIPCAITRFGKTFIGDPCCSQLWIYTIEELIHTKKEWECRNPKSWWSTDTIKIFKLYKIHESQ